MLVQTVCRVCGIEINYNRKGRSRQYCCAACRQKANRLKKLEFRYGKSGLSLR